MEPEPAPIDHDGDDMPRECVERFTRLDEGQKYTREQFGELFGNHLHHMQEQIDKVDGRLWWVLGTVIAGVAATIAVKLIGG